MSFKFVKELPGHGNEGGGKPQYLDFAQALRDNPGQWAEFPIQPSAKSSTTRASQINVGRMSGFPRGEFRAATRNGILYVRFIGEV